MAYSVSVIGVAVYSVGARTAVQDEKRIVGMGLQMSSPANEDDFKDIASVRTTKHDPSDPYDGIPEEGFKIVVYSLGDVTFN